MVRRTLFAAALGLALYACKEDLVLPPPADTGDQADPATGGGGSGGPRGDASAPRSDASDGTDAGTCTDIALTSVLRDETAEAGDPLPGNGGTIGDGSYNLEDVDVFVGLAGLPGPTGNTYRSTLRITRGTTFERVLVLGSQTSGSVAQETRTRGVITAVGTNVTISLNCPGPAQEQFTYTATDTSLLLTDIASKRRWSYTRAP